MTARTHSHAAPVRPPVRVARTMTAPGPVATRDADIGADLALIGAIPVVPTILAEVGCEANALWPGPAAGALMKAGVRLEATRGSLAEAMSGDGSMVKIISSW